MAERKRRTEAEKAQENYDTAARKVEVKQKQFDRLDEQTNRVKEELQELIEVKQFWAGHPLVKAESDSAQN